MHMKRLTVAIIFLVISTIFQQSAASPSLPITVPITVNDWHYEVSTGAGAHELSVEGSIPAGLSSELSVNDGAEPYLRNVEILTYGVWQPIPERNLSWYVPAQAQA